MTERFYNLVVRLRKYLKRQRWRILRRIRPHIVVEVAPQVRLRMRFDDQLAYSIYFLDFEHDERCFVQRFLRPGDTFVDVGANIGLFTVIGARIVGTSGRVYAFEPSKMAYDQLVSSVRLNRLTNVTCVNCALSNKAETRTMIACYDGYGAWNSLGRPSCNAPTYEETVSCITFDEFAMSVEGIGLPKLALMKIDVEGWESRVLDGAKRMLTAQLPVLMVEFTDANAISAGSSTLAVREILEDLGYNLYRYDMTAKRLIPEPVHRSYPYVNLIACQNPEEVEERLAKQ